MTVEEREACEKMGPVSVDVLESASAQLQALMLKNDDRLRKKYDMGGLVSTPTAGNVSNGEDAAIPVLVRNSVEARIV